MLRKSPTTIICQRHQLAKCHFCFNCDDYVCSKCIIEHPTHKVLYSDQAQEFWNKLSIIQGLAEYVNEIQSLKKCLDKALDELSNSFLIKIDAMKKAMEADSLTIYNLESIMTLLNDYYSNSKTMSIKISKDLNTTFEVYKDKIQNTLVTIIKKINSFQQTKNYGEYLADLSSTIHSFIPDSKTLIFLNLPLNLRYKINLHIDFNIPYYSDSLFIDNRLFIFVGSVKNDQTNLYEVDKINLTLIALAKMTMPKMAHSLIDSENYIYSVGGWNVEGCYLSECEKYSIQKNEFTLISKMNHGRAFPGLLKTNSFIYCIGGKIADDQGRIKIERYNVTDGKKWEVIEMCDPSNLCSPRSSVRCISLSNGGFAMVGGYNGRDELLNESLVGFADDKYISIVKKNRLAISDTFYWSSTHVTTPDFIHIISANINIHSLAIESDLWTVQKKINWI